MTGEKTSDLIATSLHRWSDGNTISVHQVELVVVLTVIVIVIASILRFRVFRRKPSIHP